MCNQAEHDHDSGPWLPSPVRIRDGRMGCRHRHLRDANRAAAVRLRLPLPGAYHAWPARARESIRRAKNGLQSCCSFCTHASTLSSTKPQLPNQAPITSCILKITHSPPRSGPIFLNTVESHMRPLFLLCMWMCVCRRSRASVLGCLPSFPTRCLPWRETSSCALWRPCPATALPFDSFWNTHG